MASGPVSGLTPAPISETQLRDVEASSGDIPPGTQVGEYEITAKIGEGGMGMVFGGIHPVIGKRVAIKVLAPELAHNAEVTHRFVTEARAVNQIGHRHIVDIFAFGQLPDGRHYFVMEWLEGESLAARLEHEHVMRFDEGFQVLLQICDALGAAHAKGIVHRDLKPDNVYVAPGNPPFVKLLDFGIAKLQGPDGAMSKTRTGVPMGTPLYMSPEQCRGAGVDHRTDIYALGIMMYEMFTGQTPFSADTYLVVITGHISRTPPPPSQFANIPPALEAIILKCLEKKPEDRFQNVTDLAHALRAVQSSLPADQPVLRTDAPPPTDPSDADYAALADAVGPAVAATTRVKPKPKSKTGLIIGLVAVVVLAAGGVGGALVLMKKPPDVAAAGDPAPLAPGSIVVTSDEPGAEVEVDAVKRGPAPQTVEVSRKEPHVIMVSKEGFKPFTDRVALGAKDGPKTITAKLVKMDVPRGTFVIATGLDSAVVFVDGKEVGRGLTVKAENVIAEVGHVVKVTADGRQTEERTLTVTASQVKTETFSLKRAATVKRPAGGGAPVATAGPPPPEKKSDKPKKPAGTDETLKPW
jgi:serine/threonine-protein kinase